MIARETHLAAFVIDGRPGVHGQPIRGIKGLAGASYLGERESGFVREYLALLRWLELEPGAAVAAPYEEQFEALARGKADVGIDFLDLRPRFEAALESGQRLRPLPFFEAGIHLYGSGLVASTRLIEARPEAIRRLVSALREALFATRDDPAAGLAELCRRFPATDRERALAGWRAGSPLIFDWGELGAMDRETWKRTLEHFAAVHDASTLEVEAVFDGVFVKARAEGVAAARP
jgi:ABC-type nitrate/sulfonate/bicarbonate transport system substrate-binding protein